jgi:hypothetical protein
MPDHPPFVLMRMHMEDRAHLIKETQAFNCMASSTSIRKPAVHVEGELLFFVVLLLLFVLFLFFLEGGLFRGPKLL